MMCQAGKTGELEVVELLIERLTHEPLRILAPKTSRIGQSLLKVLCGQLWFSEMDVINLQHLIKNTNDGFFLGIFVGKFNTWLSFFQSRFEISYGFVDLTSEF